jgi:hypothetical protein
VIAPIALRALPPRRWREGRLKSAPNCKFGGEGPRRSRGGGGASESACAARKPPSPRCAGDFPHDCVAREDLGLTPTFRHHAAIGPHDFNTGFAGFAAFGGQLQIATIVSAGR